MQRGSAEQHMQTSLRGIAKRAREYPKHRFGNLYSLLNEEGLRSSFAQMNRKAAPGVNGSRKLTHFTALWKLKIDPPLSLLDLSGGQLLA